WHPWRQASSGGKRASPQAVPSSSESPYYVRPRLGTAKGCLPRGLTMARTRLSAEQVAEGLAGLKGWKPDGERAISKRFVMKDHVAALGFVVKVAATAEAIDHHPEVHWV